MQQATAADGGRPLRIALLSYRSKPHCGGQGVYVRALSRELVALGHSVEVVSGPPYPELDSTDSGIERISGWSAAKRPSPWTVAR